MLSGGGLRGYFVTGVSAVLRERGCDMPVLPGIMPILNLAAIERQGELIGTAVHRTSVAREAHPLAVGAAAARRARPASSISSRMPAAWWISNS